MARFLLCLAGLILLNLPLIRLSGELRALGQRDMVWLESLAAMAGAMICAGKLVCSRWDGIFVDPQNRISLARLQLVIWTLLLVSAVVTAGFANLFVFGLAGNSLNIDIPPQVWALLGLGTFSAVAAQTITSQRQQRGEVAGNLSPGEAAWSNLIYGDNQGFAYVDVSKLQQLVFTLLIAGTYAALLWAMFGEHAPILHFPAVGGGLVALLAISHAAYLGDKQLNAT